MSDLSNPLLASSALGAVLGHAADQDKPYIVGDDGHFYNEDGERLYYWEPPGEMGDAEDRENRREKFADMAESGMYTGGYYTMDEIQAAWDADEGMGMFKTAHPDMTWEQYSAFIGERQGLIESGEMGDGLQSYDDIYESMQSGDHRYIGEAIEEGGIYTPRDELENEAYNALLDKYGIQRNYTNNDGDMYVWNGSTYTKTFKTDDHAGFTDIMDMVAKGMLGAAFGAGLTQILSGYMSAGMAEAVSNFVLNTVQNGGDVSIGDALFMALGPGGELGNVDDALLDEIVGVVTDTVLNPDNYDPQGGDWDGEVVWRDPNAVDGDDEGFDPDAGDNTYDPENVNPTLPDFIPPADGSSAGGGGGGGDTDSGDEGAPASPVDPTEPTDPTGPADPTEPTDPTGPVDPTEPADPTDPTDPVDPTSPGVGGDRPGDNRGPQFYEVDENGDVWIIDGSQDGTWNEDGTWGGEWTKVGNVNDEVEDGMAPPWWIGADPGSYGEHGESQIDPDSTAGPGSDEGEDPLDPTFGFELPDFGDFPFPTDPVGPAEPADPNAADPTPPSGGGNADPTPPSGGGNADPTPPSGGGDAGGTGETGGGSGSGDAGDGSGGSEGNGQGGGEGDGDGTGDGAGDGSGTGGGSGAGTGTGTGDGVGSGSGDGFGLEEAGMMAGAGAGYQPQWGELFQYTTLTEHQKQALLPQIDAIEKAKGMLA